MVFFVIARYSVEGSIAFVYDKEIHFRSVYQIMGLNQFGYLISNWFFFSIMNYIFMIICSLLTLGIVLYNQNQIPNLVILWFTQNIPLMFFLAMQVSIMSIIFAFNMKKVQSAQSIIQIFNNFYFIMVLYLLTFDQSWMGFFVPYFSFYFYQYQFMMLKPGNFLYFILQHIICLIIWLIIALYLDAIYPQEDDTQKPWNFFMKYFRNQEQRLSRDLEENLIEEEGLVLKNISKQFGTFKALNNINLKIYVGQTVALLGHNGAGKSTLINIITGIYKQTSGEIFYNTEKFQDLKNSGKFNIGICPAFNVLFDEMTVMEHLKMISFLKNVKNYQEKINEILKEMEMEEYKDMKIKNLSGGFQRRVNLCISLFDEPECLFLDEPTSSIDAGSRKIIWKFLIKLKQKRTKTITFLTTHHLEEAEVLAENIKVLVKGEIFAEGSVEILKQKFGVGYVLNYFFENTDHENLTHFQFVQQKLEQNFEEFQNTSLFEMNTRKLTFSVPLNLKDNIEQIIEILEKEQKENTQISINSNSLEEAYIQIENSANQNEKNYSLEEMNSFMKYLFKKNQVNWVNKMLLMIKQNFIYIYSNKLQFVSLITFYLLISFIPFIIGKINQKDQGTFQFSFIRNFLIVFSVIETFILIIIPYKIIYEKSNNIRQILLANKIFFVQYYGSLLIFHFIIQTIFGFLLYLNLILAPKFFKTDDQFTIENITYFFSELYFRKMGFFSFTFFFSIYFETTKGVLKYFTALYLLFLIVFLSLDSYFEFVFFSYFNDLAYFFLIKGTSNSNIKILIVSLFQFIFYFLILYLHDTYYNNFNYANHSSHQENLQNQTNLTEIQKTVENEKNRTQTQERDLKVLQITKKYEQTVVENVTFGIDKGINLGFLGPNGAGKTTTINMILNKITKTYGKIELKNLNIGKSQLEYFKEKNNIYYSNNFGIVNQNNSLWEKASSGEILDFFRNLNGIGEKNLNELIQYFKFDYYLQKTVEELSSGNQRKLCILISLLSNPNIFIYDEATSGVDLIMRLQLKNIFEYFKNQGSFGLFTTHFLKDIEIFCDQIALIKKGKLIYIDFIDQMKMKIGGYKIRLFFKHQEKEEEIKNLKNQLESEGECKNVQTEINSFTLHSINLHFSKIINLKQMIRKLNEFKQQNQIEEFSIRQLSIDDIYLLIMESNQILQI